MTIRFSNIKISENLKVFTVSESLPSVFDGTSVDQTLPIIFAGSEATFFSSNITTLPIEFLPLDSTVFNSNDLLVAPIGFESTDYVVFNSDTVSTLPLTFL